MLNLGCTTCSPVEGHLDENPQAQIRRDEEATFLANEAMLDQSPALGDVPEACSLGVPVAIRMVMVVTAREPGQYAPRVIGEKVDDDTRMQPHATYVSDDRPIVKSTRAVVVDSKAVPASRPP